MLKIYSAVFYDFLFGDEIAHVTSAVLRAIGSGNE